MIANLGWKEAVAREPALYKGVNLAHGKLTYKAVAEDLGLPYEALKI